MDRYSNFAEFYDLLTEDIDYKNRALYFHSLINIFGNGGKKLLDLACGTGSLSIEMSNLGYDVTGVDRSINMLSMARNKVESKDILYISQSMENLDLPKRVSVVISALDSINHLDSTTDLEKTFENVANSLEEKGIFIFDINTEYKQKYVLGDNVFVFETKEVFCVWQNFYNEKKKSTEIILDFFKENNNHYKRYSEFFIEKIYTAKQLISAIEKADLKIIKIFADDSYDIETENTQRLIYILRKD